NETLPKALLFTNKPTTTPLYKALSVDFKDSILVGEVKSSEKNIVAEFGIQSFPTLLVISPEHGPVKFDGKLNHQNLKSFMQKYASPSSQEQPPLEQPKKIKQLKPVTAFENDHVFSKSCLKSSPNTICVVAITNEDDKQETVGTLNTLKEKIIPSEAFEFQLGWIHADQSQSIIQDLQLSQDSPLLFFLHPSKQLYRNYIGSWNEKNLLAWINQIGSGRVQAWPYKSELKITEKPMDHDEL
ncbi:protein disulfide isomerase (PDI) protein, partial [Rhizopus stolonifer]